VLNESSSVRINKKPKEKYMLQSKRLVLEEKNGAGDTIFELNKQLKDMSTFMANDL